MSDSELIDDSIVEPTPEKQMNYRKPSKIIESSDEEDEVHIIEDSGGESEPEDGETLNSSHENSSSEEVDDSQNETSEDDSDEKSTKDSIISRKPYKKSVRRIESSDDDDEEESSSQNSDSINNVKDSVITISSSDENENDTLPSPSKLKDIGFSNLKSSTPNLEDTKVFSDINKPAYSTPIQHLRDSTNLNTPVSIKQAKKTWEPSPVLPEIQKPTTESSTDASSRDTSGAERSYTDDDISNIKKEIDKKTVLIDRNQKLLKFQKNLPNDGAKLKSFISGLIESKNSLTQELEVAQKNRIESSPVDPVAKASQLRSKLDDLRAQYSVINPQSNPKKISALKEEIAKNQMELIKIEKDLPSAKSGWEMMKEKGFNFANQLASNLWASAPAENKLYGGRMNVARKMEVITVTQEAITKLHDSLQTMPNENDEENDPPGLKSAISLFPHQKQALAWLTWRETQQPPGGILADDMGLGKTLTIISLVLKDKFISAGASSSEWLETKSVKGVSIKSKSTLIVCPASLLGQWEGEVKKRVKSGTLEVCVYHGSNRKMSARALARYDLVITTYNTVMHEIKGILSDKKLEDLQPEIIDESKTRHIQLLNVAWNRIVLDEAHTIRNPQSQTARAICRLKAAKRWCVTGTPIQNKELDMYSLIRFLRCSPFDEYKVWKLWVANKTSMGQTRLNTIVKSLLLRRTKDQKSTLTGEALVTLPSKSIQEHRIVLETEERKVYDRVFSFSQNAMINYMKKNNDETDDSNKFVYNQITSSNSNFTSTETIKTHHLLVLLLRLRQICCHPALIHSMLDTESKTVEGIVNEDEDELDLISKMGDMVLDSKGPDPIVDEKSDDSVMNRSNPVFHDGNKSSKILTLVSALKNIADKEGYEKVVIVSQWTTMLEIVQSHVEAISGMSTVAINGKIPVKSRGQIVDDFNRSGRGPRVMLLSLGAGGVGLNLTGANHLFLLDMHWNPQLERQACDRVYRVGQTKEVTIHKFLCEETVESKILLLQQKKLQLADGVLTGAKRTGVNKLTLQDLQMLFNVK